MEMYLQFLEQRAEFDMIEIMKDSEVPVLELTHGNSNHHCGADCSGELGRGKLS